LSLLGAPAADVDGEQVAVDTRKAIALLAYLAVEGGAHSRDSLAALLWPEYDGDRARAALRRTLSTLRAALGGRWVEARRDTICLDRAGVVSDVDEARRLADAGELEAAAALHRGPFLAGFGLRDSPAFDSWQSFTAGTLTRELASVLDRAVAASAARGEWAAAIEHARRRLALDPVNEPAHRRLIALYAEAGERNAAVDQYRECVRTLYRELGVAPIDSTTALYRSILEGAAAAPSEAAGPPPGRAEHTLVGRDREWRALRDAYGAVRESGVLVAIEGETGIGKTRLGEELVAWARAGGAVGISVRCFEPESGLAFGTAISLVRAALEEGNRDGVDPAAAAEAARIVPELGTPPTPSLEDAGAQARFLDGLARTLLGAAAGKRPPVIFVDDIHWADTASLEALAYLARRLRRTPLLLAASWRPEETPPGHPARALLAGAAREGLARTIAPARLGSDEVAELAAAAGVSGELAGRLYDETQGIPFFVV